MAFLITACILLLLLSLGSHASGTQSASVSCHFIENLDDLRQSARIPGMAAAVVIDGRLAWSKGFGFADLATRTPVAEDTPFGLASVTKPFAAILLMRLVDREALDLDSSARMYGIDVGNDRITVRHLLSHTSEAVPGTTYRYNGGRYALLTTVIEQLYGAPFRQVLRDELLSPLGMEASALNAPDLGTECLEVLGYQGESAHEYAHVRESAATPYAYDTQYGAYPVSVPTYANAAAGLVSTVGDLARFASALDQGGLVPDPAAREMFSPVQLASGASSPYGLGSFVESVDETPFLWHYGYGAYSSLFLHVPELRLTFILLANSPNLSRPFGLGMDGVSVLASPFAMTFYREFIASANSEGLQELEWTASVDRIVSQLNAIEDPLGRDIAEMALWGRRKLFAGVGMDLQVSRLRAAHMRAFPDSEPTWQDLYTVERPGPEPPKTNPPREQETARWMGIYELQEAEHGADLPERIALCTNHAGELVVSTSNGGTQVGTLMAEERLRLIGETGDDVYLGGVGEGARYERIEVVLDDTFVGTYVRCP